MNFSFRCSLFLLVTLAVTLTATRPSFAQSTDFSAVRSPKEIRSAAQSLREPDVAWRKIRWKTCLLDGLAESARTNKPLMLWIFIDRPIDDERC